MREPQERKNAELNCENRKNYKNRFVWIHIQQSGSLFILWGWAAW